MNDMKLTQEEIQKYNEMALNQELQNQRNQEENIKSKEQQQEDFKNQWMKEQIEKLEPLYSQLQEIKEDDTKYLMLQLKLSNRIYEIPFKGTDVLYLGEKGILINQDFEILVVENNGGYLNKVRTLSKEQILHSEVLNETIANVVVINGYYYQLTEPTKADKHINDVNLHLMTRMGKY